MSATSIDRKGLLQRLPDAYATVESVRGIVEFLESLADRCDGPGRSPRSEGLDDITAHVTKLSGAVMPCLLHAGEHGSDVCWSTRGVVAESAWDLDEISRRKGAPGTAFRGKARMWALLEQGIPAARGALHLAVAVALAQERDGQAAPDALLSLVHSPGGAQGKLQIRIARRIAAFWSVSWRGDLEDRLWTLHDRLRTHIVVPSDTDVPLVSRGRRRGAMKQHVESLRKQEARLRTRVRKGQRPQMRLLAETGAELRLRDLLGGGSVPGEWYIRMTTSRQRWQWLNLYIGFLAEAWHDAAVESEQAMRQGEKRGERSNETPGALDARASIPLDSEGHWDGFHVTRHEQRRRQRRTEPDHPGD